MSPRVENPGFGRSVAIGLMVAGAAIMIGSVFADAIGLSGGGEGFGWKQLIAAIAGLVLLLIGLAWLLRPAAADVDFDE